MSSEMWTAVIGLIVMFVTNWGTWFFTRKRQTQDTKSVELDNVQEVITIYKGLMNDLKESFDQRMNEQKIFFEERETQHQNNHNEVVKKLERLQLDYENLEKRYKELVKIRKQESV